MPRNRNGYPNAGGRAARPSRRAGPEVGSRLDGLGPWTGEQVSAARAAATAQLNAEIAAAIPGLHDGVRAAGKAAGWLGIGLGAWAVWDQLRPYLQNMTPPAGWAFCRFCGVIPGSACLDASSSGIYYLAGSPTGCASAGAQCQLAQSVSGLSRTDIFPGQATRLYYLAYQVACGVTVRANTVMTWARTGTKDNTAPLPVPLNPPIGWTVPSSLTPALAAGETGLMAGAIRAAPTWAAVPNMPSLPLSYQTRSAGYHAPDRGKEGWIFPPIVVDIDVGADGAHVTRVVRPADAVRTGHAEPERKHQIRREFMSAFRAMAWFSEANDLVEVLFRALPRNVQRRYRRIYGNNMMMRARALRDHWQEIDLGAAIQWWLLNEMEDRAYGTAFAGVGEAARRYDPTGNLWRAVQSYGL